MHPIIKSILRPICEPFRKARRQRQFQDRTDALARERARCQNGAIFLVGSPLHGNLGDHAISLAELKFIKDYFPDTPVLEVFGAHFKADSRNIAKLVRRGDIITVTGGGFLGNLWIGEEEMVRTVIRSFPDNKIVIFPQTIFFAEGKDREKQIATTRAVYQNHRDLHLFVRNQASLDWVNQHLVGGSFHDCRLVPDIVAYLDESATGVERQGALLCLRGDKEAVLNDEDRETIRRYARETFGDTTTTGTVLMQDVGPAQRVDLFHKKLNEFKRAELVITDRLHGMLFAAITGTPCVALGNSSGKVKGVYEWIKNLDYIEYADEVDSIPARLARLKELGACRYDKSHLLPEFDAIAKVIMGE